MRQRAADRQAGVAHTRCGHCVHAETRLARGEASANAYCHATMTSDSVPTGVPYVEARAGLRVPRSLGKLAIARACAHERKHGGGQSLRFQSSIHCV